jgi:hypothetical protein
LKNELSQFFKISILFLHGFFFGFFQRKPDTSLQNIIVGLQKSITADVNKLTEFCRKLPGFSDLSRLEQHCRISAKYTVTWLVMNQHLLGQGLLVKGDVSPSTHFSQQPLQRVIN